MSQNDDKFLLRLEISRSSGHTARRLMPKLFRHIRGYGLSAVSNTVGMLLEVAVHPANIQGREGAGLVISKFMGQFPRLELIWADGGYRGQLAD